VCILYKVHGKDLKLFMQVGFMKLELKAIPSSEQQKIIIDKNNLVKVYLKSSPVDGKANRELVKFLAKKLGVPSQYIKIVRGTTSRKKLLEIFGFESKKTLYETLGLSVQGFLFEE